MQKISPVVLNLIIINALVFFAQAATGGSGVSTASDLFALHHYKSEYFKPYQIVTHMFMHASIGHLFFNMFSLYMFGSSLESYLNQKKFLILYFICGFVAGLTQIGAYAVEFWQVDHSILNSSHSEEYQMILRGSYTVGASGAIMGVLAAFGYLFKDTEMIIFPLPIPIKAKWAIGGMIALDVFGGIVKVQGDQVAHWAHVGGAVAGLLIILYWNKSNRRTFY